MKRILLVLLSFFMLSVDMEAAPVDKEQARKKAAGFMTARGLKIGEMKLAKTAPRKMAGGVDATGGAYYVFNAEQEKGFVIISGDDRTDDILGYSDKGSFTEGELPVNFKAWLDGYAEQINSMEMEEETSGGTPSSIKAPQKRDAISPMITTQWNQDAPFNNLCPDYASGKKSVTGCAATALAQLMYYHRWPEGYTSMDIPAYITDTRRIYMPELPAAKFEWNKMPLNHTEEDKDSAVAKLMLYVGQAIETDYYIVSAANVMYDAVSAVKKYFGYAQNTEYKSRENYSFEEWHNIVYSELAESRPVMYRGNSDGGGHAFICDGYDGNGMYHINWGWGGYCDGYFRLEVLNPEGAGIGGTSSMGGYSFNHGCIVGMKKTQGNAKNDLYLSAYSLRATDTSILCNIYNETTEESTFNIGWGLLNDNGTISRVIQTMYGNYDLRPQYGFKDVCLNLRDIDLNKGTYKIVPISKEEKNGNWKSALPSFAYAEVTIDWLGSKTATLHPIRDLQITSMKCSDTMFQNNAAPVTLNVNNVGEEYNGMLYLYASKNGKDNWQLAATEGVYLAKGENDSIVMHPKFKDGGKLYVAVSTGNSVQEFITTDTLHVEPITCPINLKCESIIPRQEGDLIINKIKLKNDSKEYFANQVEVYGFKTDGNAAEDIYSYISTLYNIVIPPGETYTFEHTTTDIEPNMYYAISLTAYDQVDNLWIRLGDGKWYFVTSAGIEGVLMDETVKPTGMNSFYYTPSGIKVDKPTRKGMYIYNGKKIIIK